MTREEGNLPRPWSDDEIEILKKLYAEKPSEDLAEQLGRSLPAVRQRAHMLGLKRKIQYEGRWTPDDIALLTELYPTCPLPEIAEKLGRTVASIKHRAYSLGVKRKSYVDKLWTPEETQMLRDLYPNCKSTREVAKKIGRPWGSVRQIASNLGISRQQYPRDFGEL